MKDLDVILPKSKCRILGHGCKQTGEESLQMVISHVLHWLVSCATMDTGTCHCNHPLPNQEQMGKPVAGCEFVSQLTAFLSLPAPRNVQATV